jgi:uncharacterized membrane protein
MIIPMNPNIFKDTKNIYQKKNIKIYQKNFKEKRMKKNNSKYIYYIRILSIVIIFSTIFYIIKP